MRLELSPEDQRMLDGDEGKAVALAMRVVTRTAQAMGAERLLTITGAHIDSCLFHGRAGLDFAATLAGHGARVRVPTTLNVSSLDLLHPELYRGDEDEGRQARELMEHYETMGCAPTWTCAPYQESVRPALGENVAWAESNAIVFANSVLGARTHRYGDFIDIAAAITGRAPAAGLHLDQNRLGEVIFDLGALSDEVLAHRLLAPVLGHLIGAATGNAVPVVIGARIMSEDQLKALGSAAASSGSVGMFHVVGSTPEAVTLEQALGHRGKGSEIVTVDVTPAELNRAWSQLSTAVTGSVGAISLGTPHYSVPEFSHLVTLLRDRRIHPDIDFYVCTGREVLTEVDLRGWVGPLEDAGVQIVTDTCTYITPIMAPFDGLAMTDSPKWAYYAPGNLGVDVIFGTTEDCVATAVAGILTRADPPW